VLGRAPAEINLLANFTAWAIISAQTAFTVLFKP
jgi:hypothetical protein